MSEQHQPLPLFLLAASIVLPLVSMVAISGPHGFRFGMLMGIFLEGLLDIPGNN